MKCRLKKCIAILIVITLMISTIPVTSVHAEEIDRNIIESLSNVVQGEARKTLESLIDANSKNNGGDWKKAVFKDKFYWNSFHNAVQTDIRVKNAGIAQKELPIVYSEYNDKELRGKRGELTYIWSLLISIIQYVFGK